MKKCSLPTGGGIILKFQEYTKVNGVVPTLDPGLYLFCGPVDLKQGGLYIGGLSCVFVA